MKQNEKLTRGKFIRLSDEDVRQIADTANWLDLPASEVARRSIRIALPILRDLNLPGARKREQTA